MKKFLLVISALSVISACRYDREEIPKPDLTCVTDPVIHVVPVAIGDDFFSPASIEIISGDTVKWTYTSSGTEAHTSTCDGTNGSTLPSGGTTWDSGSANPLLPGDTFKKAIVTPGTYTYICTIHGSMMSGTILVKPRCQ